MTLISRNPFARTELHREIVFVPNDVGCNWCGSRRPGKTPTLFRYRTETDGGRKHEHQGLWCSKSCHDKSYR